MKRVGVCLLFLLIAVKSYAQCETFITVDAPCVSETNRFQLSFISYNPLDFKWNGSIYDVGFSLRADALYWIIQIPNWGIKIVYSDFAFPLCLGLSWNYLQFDGNDWIVDKVNSLFELPITLNEANLNFYSSQWNVMAGWRAKKWGAYLIGDFLYIGNSEATTENIRLVGAGEIDWGKITLFMEIGYYFVFDSETTESDNGLFSGGVNQHWTIGGGLEWRFSLFYLKAGVLYPGFSVAITDNYAFSMPVLPYLDFGMRF